MTVTVPTPEVTYTQDMAIWPVLTDMAACLCRELIDRGLPPTCFCGIFPGEVAVDYVGDGDEGQAWVRVISIFPSSSFPSQESGARLSCEVGLAAELELAVMRCAPTGDGLNPPTAADQWEATRLQLADMAAMRRAVQCCYSESKLVQLGRYRPLGPQGGTVGGAWQVFVSESANLSRQPGAPRGRGPRRG